MKNSLLGVNVEKTLDTDERLVSYSDLLELIVMNKIQRGDFDAAASETAREPEQMMMGLRNPLRRGDKTAPGTPPAKWGSFPVPAGRGERGHRRRGHSSRDIVEQMTAALGPEYEDEWDCCDDCDEALTDKTTTFDSDSRRLLCAGYTDCMDEAIRFLVEEENISPEHPVVRNLKAHLEQSKERILETVAAVESSSNDSNNNNNGSRYHHPSPYHEFLISSQCAWNTG